MSILNKITSIGVEHMTSGNSKRLAGIRPLWFGPAILLVSFILVFATFLWLLRENSYKTHRRELAANAELVKESIRLRLNGNRDYLLIIAQERGDGFMDAKTFQERASSYVADHPEMICINWVDAGYHITDVAPIAPNKHIVGLRLNLPEPKRASRLAMETRQPVYTHPFEVVQGELAFELWVPVFHDDVFIGLFGGIYSYEKLLRSLDGPQLLKTTNVSVVDTTGKVLLKRPLTGEMDEKLTHQVSLSPPDNGGILRFTGYGRGAVGWGLLTLEFICVALVLTMAYAMWGLKHEIEVRRQAEEAQRRERALLRCIIDAASDVIFIKSHDGVYLGCNKASEEFIGLPESEQIGKTDFDFFDQDMANTIRETDRQVFEEGKNLRTEEWVTYPDGHSVLLDTLKAPFYGSDGEISGLVEISRNITERKRSEEALHLQTVELEQEVAERQQAQEALQEQALLLENEMDERRTAQDELEKLNESLEQRVAERTTELEQANIRLQELDRMKSMFIASMSHELRTPLNSVIGFSRILHNEWLGPLNGEQKENLATVLKSGKLLLSLINDIIDVSKIEAGMIEAVLKDFDIFDVVSEAVTTFENYFRDKGVRLTVQGIHHIMQTDRTRLLQCLLNLVSNAIKYTENGTITVSAALPDGGDMLELSVADTGIGIREEDLDKLFSPFVRLDSHLKSTVPGTGLGLYLTKMLVREVLQGDITVQSAPGIGSRFVLTVPIFLQQDNGKSPLTPLS